MSPVRRNARGEVSLQRILDATVELVGRYGYDNTTIARITKVTQLPASSIYWYFRDKDELITTALESFYARFTPGDRPWQWQHFDPSLPMAAVLTDELEPQLRASESETPLRLGITLALEGGAARSKIQEPFRRRRAGAFQSIETWWTAAYTAQGTDDTDRTAGVWWMSTLTLALLDGHYIADVVVDGPTTVTERSRIAALCLTAVFAATPPPIEAANPDEPEVCHRRQVLLEEETGPPALLHATCHLVAERGYEGATIGRICTAAGMQRSSVYWRYKDKDTLIKAAVAEPFLDLFAPIHELSDSSGNWTRDLATAIGATMRAAHENPDQVKAGLLLKVQQWDPPTAGAVAVLEGTAAVEAALRAWFARVLPPGDRAEVLGEHLSWIVLRLIEGSMLSSSLGRPAPVEGLTNVFAVMMDGVVGR